MADKKFKTIGTGRAGEVRSVKGSEAGKDAKYDAIAEKDEVQRYNNAHGAGGLGGARKASDPKFQAARKAHMSKWRKARKAAKGKGRKKAASKLPTPKPEETP